MTLAHAGDPPIRCEPTGQSAVLVVMAGVPGAGKSTAMRAVSRDLSRAGPEARQVRVLDSDTYRAWLAARLPAKTPYRWYRPLTHLAHQGRLVAVLLAGPAPRGRGERPLLVHEPGTRSWWRAGVGRLARARGWRTCLVYLDVTRPEALRGQLARGRVLREDAFARHWRRWEELRGLVVAGRTGPATSLWRGWQRVRITGRDDVVRVLLTELGSGSQAAGSGAAADVTSSRVCRIRHPRRGDRRRPSGVGDPPAARTKPIAAPVALPDQQHEQAEQVVGG